MSNPDVNLAKIFIGTTILIIAILPFSLIIIYLKISAKCKNPEATPKQKPSMSGGKKFGISLLVIAILSGLTAQAINQSYPIQKFQKKKPNS